MNLLSKIVGTVAEAVVDVVELSTCVFVDAVLILPDLTSQEEMFHRTAEKIKEMKDE